MSVSKSILVMQTAQHRALPANVPGCEPSPNDLLISELKVMPAIGTVLMRIAGQREKEPQGMRLQPHSFISKTHGHKRRGVSLFVMPERTFVTCRGSSLIKKQGNPHFYGGPGGPIRGGHRASASLVIPNSSSFFLLGFRVS